MSSSQQRLGGSLAPPTQRQHVDDWEEWEDDDVVTPIDTGEQVLIQSASPTTTTQRKTISRPPTTRASSNSAAKISRLKSRKRQKAQNARAGIKVITDMAAFRRQNHIANQIRSPNRRPVKFVDAAALKALEGEPNSASVGNWNWLKRNKNLSPSSASVTQQPTRSLDQGLSPQDRPIVIGITLPSEEADNREISPQTATVHDLQTPVEPRKGNTLLALGLPPVPHQAFSSTSDVSQPTSVWSPDTPDTASSFSSYRPASSVYSQATAPGAVVIKDVPPVPTVPLNYQNKPQHKLLSLELGRSTGDEDDSGTPCTLFEEDGTASPLKLGGGKLSARTPDSAGSRSHGWWDHVVTPFVDRKMSFSSRKTKVESPNAEAEQEWWKISSGNDARPQEHKPPQAPRVLVQPPIVRAPTPRRTPPPRVNTPARSVPQAPSVQSTPASEEVVVREKPPIIITDEPHSDHPPPYSPPKKESHSAPIRYRAVFPPGHALHAQFPPSPRPSSPGLAGTMTSQGRSQTTEVPRTSPTRSHSPIALPVLPNRAIGTCVPDRYDAAAPGTANRVERQRRRHEKEEIMARRVGGFWRGRGCMPDRGCFGRTGREGRKRRRVWLAIWAGIITLMVLVIVLAVVLTRPHPTHEVPSIWVNLTDFPPMPTGALTVVGSDNIAARSICTEPSTLWSCSLPKEKHDTVLPFKPNQPTMFMQIQWDNGTAKSWDVPNGDAPPQAPKASRRGLRGAFGADDTPIVARDTAIGFKPNPKPPDFKEMWFLGDTTDGIVSDQKAGEPTPFYISLLNSVNETTGSAKPTKRATSEDGDIPDLLSKLPHPALDTDGTSAPAVMLPNPVQQPVRLYDRGLPTEHYGFYTHFSRTIFVKSVIVNETQEGDVPLDEDGGCRKGEADFLVSWSQTRLLVQIWTRKLDQNTTSLLKPGSSGRIKGSPQLIRPGSMPYPVTVKLDTHGGDPSLKVVAVYPIDDRQHLHVDEVKATVNQMDLGGTWINPRGKNGNAKFGGFDGGTGGCKCEWVNFV